MSGTTGSDPIQTEIHRKAVENIVNEMALTLVRTSGSPVVTDSNDFSTCLLDEAGEQIAVSAYVLLHTATSWLNTDAIIRQLRQDGVDPRPGDGWIVNDPWYGAQHQGDVGIVMPTFYRDQCVGWAFSNLHVVDIGGAGVSGCAPGAVSVFDEALRFGAIRIISDSELEPEWKRYIAANVRTPKPVLNDLRSMIAANNVAQRKLTELIDRYGLERHREHNARNKQLTEELLRRRIEAMPDGRYEAVEYIELDSRGADQLLEIRCAMTVDGSDLRFEFTGDPQVQAYVNGTRGTVYAGVITHLVTMLGYGDLPVNAGIWRPLEIDLGEPGTVVNATAPAPVSVGHGEAGYRAGKAVRNVLNQAASLSSDATLRSRVGGIHSDALTAAFLFGQGERGEPSVLVFLDPVTGVGGGAQTVSDGQDMYGTCSAAGAGVPDVEAHEATDPVLFLWRRIARNNGGPGQLRGGQGLDEAYLLLGGSPFAGFGTMTCAEFPPPGSGGGLPPSTSEQHPIRATAYAHNGDVHARQPLTEEDLGGTPELIGIKAPYLVLEPGDVLHTIGGGGAGLGDPLLRDPRLVAADVRDDYITADHALAAYGVVLDAEGSVDEAATERRREQIRTDRLGAAPERRAAPPDTPGVAVVVDHGDDQGGVWRCASCETELAPVEDGWRESVLRREIPIAEFYSQLGMYVRKRAVEPHISIVQSYCPSCAACLATDVVTDRAGHPASPQLARAQLAGAVPVSSRR